MGESIFTPLPTKLLTEYYTDAVFIIGCNRDVEEKEAQALPSCYEGVRLFYNREPRLCVEAPPQCWDFSEPTLNPMSCEWHCPPLTHQYIGFFTGLISSTALAGGVSIVSIAALILVKRRMDQSNEEDRHTELHDEH